MIASDERAVATLVPLLAAWKFKDPQAAVQLIIRELERDGLVIVDAGAPPRASETTT